MSVVLTILECMFDYRGVSPQATSSRINELQQRVQRMQGSAISRTLESLPGLSGVLQLRTGEAYAVDSPSLAMALVAGASQAGEWIAIVGAPDLGLEAAAGFGIDLERTVVVPHPGELWLSVTAGLLDVATVVIAKPPCASQRAAGRTAEVEAPDKGCGLGVLGRVAKVRRDSDHHRVLLARAGTRAWPTHCSSSGGLGSPGRTGTPRTALAAGTRSTSRRARHTVVPLAVAQAG